jgi:hypothetical protein
MCKAHAIPTPEILAVFTPVDKLLEFPSGLPPKRHLFVKPRNGVASDGTEHFRWQGAVFDSDRTSRLSPENLSDYLAARARNEKRTLLVQPALSNHPELGLGANPNLATARLVTGLTINGDVIPIFSHIYFFHFAGINQISLTPRVALIDVSSGRLASTPRELYRSKLGNDKLDESFKDGIVLPDWDNALRHAAVAHQACSNFVFVGWDVAFTDHGPMLLEGNAHWNATAYQRLRGEPLGCTKFADILATRIRDLESA